MASVDYPYPDPKDESERAANRKAEDDYQRQEEEAAAFDELARELPMVPPAVLLEQVRLDLATAGLHMTPLEPSSDEDQCGVVVYLTDDAQVVVDWSPHARLDHAALGALAADRMDGEAAVRSELVRTAMDTTLGAILAGFRYTTRRPRSGFGHIVVPGT
ncbi:hypothetical protein ACFCZ6_14500 [Streptomyces hydrogenans]|uniref:hypothetical protein n=1 Tax=Streptomyces hydrogenans TaxID=1873719 RepID=UPI0035E2EE98